MAARKPRRKRKPATRLPKPKPVLEVEARPERDPETPAPEVAVATATGTALLEETRALLDAPARSSYDALALERVRKCLGEHQGKVAKKIERILNGQNLTLADIKLPQEDDPREPPLERLRRYMRRLQEARQRLDTPSYGLCEVCDTPLPEEALVSFPWLMRCTACGPKDARLSARPAE